MVKRIIIANIAVFLVQGLSGSREMINDTLALSTPAMERGYLWQPFSYMWLHDGPMHILFNMFALWMFGGNLESVWGAKRFLRFYLYCGVGAGFIIYIWNLLTDVTIPTLGASGAVFGLLTAFSLMWPNQTIMLLFPPIPMKAIWFIPVLFLMQLMFSSGGNVSHIGHLGGVLIAAFILRSELRSVINLRSLRYRWHRYRMRNKLRAVRKEEWEKKRNKDDDRPTFH